MNLQFWISELQRLATGVWDAFRAEPLIFPLKIVLAVLAVRWGIGLFRWLYQVFFYSKHLVHLKITLPREDSQKDKERSEDKDFKKKVSVMEHFFQNINEMSELSLRNNIYTTVFRGDIMTFEVVAENKVVDFYVVCPKRY